MDPTPKISPTQRRILAVLSDGHAHTRQELHKCLWDDQSPLSALWKPISLLRKVLRPKGEDIICEMSGWRICYRHVRLLAGAKAAQE